MDRRMWEWTAPSFCSASVLHVLHFICYVGFYVAYLINLKECEPVTDSRYIFALQPVMCFHWVSQMFMSRHVRQYEEFNNLKLTLAWDYRTCNSVHVILSFVLSLPFPLSRSLGIFHWEQKLFVSFVSMDTIVDSSNEFDTCVVCMCIFAHFHASLPHTFNPFPPALSLQQPAPLDWRIWVIWTTKGLLDTGAPSANTTQLDAQMMTPKVFCGLTLGWNQCVNIAWYRNICWPVWNTVRRTNRSPMSLSKLHRYSSV